MSSDYLKFDVHIDDKALKEQMENILDAKTMTEIQTLFAKTIDPWVPFLEGPLSQTLNITPEYIEYLMPYARRQYYGEEFNHTKDYHPLATAKWDQVAMQTELDSFMQQVREIITRRAIELYG